MDILDKLAKEYGTDKRSDVHNYTPIYERLMRHNHLSPINLLEIGLWHGASARMWSDYFPNGQIYMVDNNTDLVKAFEYGSPARGNVHTILSHQTMINWDALPRLDYVIDDGSHDSDDQLGTLWRGFGTLNPGGLWIIEDTHANFHANDFDPPANEIYHWLLRKMINQQFDGYGYGDFYKAVREFPEEDRLTKMIYGIQSYKSLIILERAHDVQGEEK